MHIAFCEDYKMQIYSHRTPMNSWNIVGKTTEKKKKLVWKNQYLLLNEQMQKK